LLYNIDGGERKSYASGFQIKISYQDNENSSSLGGTFDIKNSFEGSLTEMIPVEY